MDSSGFLVSYDTSIFILALKVSRYNLKIPSCVNASKKLVVLQRIINALTLNSPMFALQKCSKIANPVLATARL